MEKQLQQLTVTEALEQGYTKYAFGNTDFGFLYNLSSITEDDFDSDKELYLADKEETFAYISGEDIYDMVQDNVMNCEIASSDDTDALPDLLKTEINWEEIAERINAVCRKHPYRYVTHIKLIPNPVEAGDQK